MFNFSVRQFSKKLTIYRKLNSVETGVGAYLTVHYNLMNEFVPIKWRARIVSVPVWGVSGGFFALVAWILKDWKYIHLVTAATGIPCIFVILVSFNNHI